MGEDEEQRRPIIKRRLLLATEYSLFVNANVPEISHAKTGNPFNFCDLPSHSSSWVAKTTKNTFPHATCVPILDNGFLFDDS